jgi:hypothetical protein
MRHQAMQSFSHQQCQNPQPRLLAQIALNNIRRGGRGARVFPQSIQAEFPDTMPISFLRLRLGLQRAVFKTKATFPVKHPQLRRFFFQRHALQ